MTGATQSMMEGGGSGDGGGTPSETSSDSDRPGSNSDKKGGDREASTSSSESASFDTSAEMAKLEKDLITTDKLKPESNGGYHLVDIDKFLGIGENVAMGLEYMGKLETWANAELKTFSSLGGAAAKAGLGITVFRAGFGWSDKYFNQGRSFPDSVASQALETLQDQTFYELWGDALPTKETYDFIESEVMRLGADPYGTGFFRDLER